MQICQNGLLEKIYVMCFNISSIIMYSVIKIYVTGAQKNVSAVVQPWHVHVQAFR